MKLEIFIAICALFVSIVTTAFSIWSQFLQRKHMRLSVRPIAHIQPLDYEDCVAVLLENKGTGPMMIKKVVVKNGDGVMKNNLISHMSDLQGRVVWSDFSSKPSDRVLGVGESINLLLLKGDPDDPLFVKNRDDVRRLLKKLMVRIEYCDIYGILMAPEEKMLKWFGRWDAQ